MKQFLIAIVVLLGLLIPATVIAQPAPPHRYGYDVVKHCYTVWVPFPHSRCEWVYVRHSYRPVPPPPRNYTPAPPPPGPRPGHHPPPPPPHHGGPGHHGHGGPHH